MSARGGAGVEQTVVSALDGVEGGVRHMSLYHRGGGEGATLPLGAMCFTKFG